MQAIQTRHRRRSDLSSGDLLTAWGLAGVLIIALLSLSVWQWL